MKLTPEDIAPIVQYREDDFNRWLRVGLEGYCSPKPTVWGFDPLAQFIGINAHLATDIAAIYDACPPRQKAALRAAVAYVFATVVQTSQNLPIFEQLLHLATVLPAHEIMKVLPSCIGAGSMLDKLRNTEGGGILGTALSAVAEIATPTEDAETSLLGLVTAREFKPAYAPLALVSLCRVAPTKLSEHMDLLRGALRSVFSSKSFYAAKKRSLAKDVLNAVGLDQLQRALPRLRVNLFYADNAEDEWLLSSLLSGETPELVYGQDGGRSYLERAAAGGVRVHVDDSASVQVIREPNPFQEEQWAIAMSESRQYSDFMAENAETVGAMFILFGLPEATYVDNKMLEETDAKDD